MVSLESDIEALSLCFMALVMYPTHRSFLG